MPQEHIEWCDIWIPDAEVDVHPRVLLIGDSIVRQYYQGVNDQLSGTASVARLTGSRCIGDPVLLGELRLVLPLYPFDIVHVNNGLHGWKNTEDVYDRHFPAYLDAIRELAPAARVIWATTTPMFNGGENQSPHEHSSRILARNRIAERHAAAREIAIDDLYAVCDGHPEYFSPDGVHFAPEGVEVLARQVAGCLAGVITQTSSK